MDDLIQPASTQIVFSEGSVCIHYHKVMTQKARVLGLKLWQDSPVTPHRTHTFLVTFSHF